MVEVKRELRSRNLLLILGLLFLATLILRFKFGAGLSAPVNFPTALVTLQLGILLSLSGLYFYAARFYEDAFYSFLSFGSFANAVSILFDWLFSLEGRALFLSYVLTILSTLPIYIGTFFDKKRPTPYRLIFTSVARWVLWLAVSYFFLSMIVDRNTFGLNLRSRSSLLVVGAVPFFALTLIRVARSFRSRLLSSVHGSWAFLLPLTFYCSAALQLPYAVVWVGPVIILFIEFFFGFLLKVATAIGLLTILRLDLINVLKRTRDLEEQSLERSELEDLGALTASIEHDLKTPLGIINLEIAGMKRTHQANDKVIADLERIERATRRIYAVTQIVTVLRSKDYYRQLMAKTNVAELVHQSVSAVRKGTGVPKTFFKIDVKERIFIRAYGPMLETAIVNILKNSLDAISEAKHRGGVIRITTRKVWPEETLIQLMIADNGCGIPPENIPKLTSLFTTKIQQKPNSGLGLFITGRIVEFHDGEIQVESQLGKGTTVSLFLPKWNTAL